MRETSGSSDYPKRAQGCFRPAQEARIISGLEQQRQREAASSIDGERVRRFGQASFDGGTAFKSMWKPGVLYLTEQRLLFFQGSRRLVDVAIADLKQITVVRRNWVPGRTVDQICLMEQNTKRKRTFYMYLANPQPWKDALDKALDERRG